MNPVFFQSENQRQLYGVYHPPSRSVGSSPRAVVICSPLGQEYIRSHWSCKLLAKQMARGGAHVLRFDLSGHGNSAGNMNEQQSLRSWTDDINHSIDWIRETANADSVMLVGLRFGATLAALTAAQRHDVYSLVAWEPVIDGADYLTKLRTMHSRMIDLWVSKISTPNDSEQEEILGFELTRSLLNEIEQIKLDLSKLNLPQLIVDLESSSQQYSHVEPSLQRTIRTDDEPGWDKLLTMETAWLRPQTTRLIVKSVADMFNRLERITALHSDQPQQLAEIV